MIYRRCIVIIALAPSYRPSSPSILHVHSFPRTPIVRADESSTQTASRRSGSAQQTVAKIPIGLHNFAEPVLCSQAGAGRPYLCACVRACILFFMRWFVVDAFFAGMPDFPGIGPPRCDVRTSPALIFVALVLLLDPRTKVGPVQHQRGKIVNEPRF